MRNFKQFIAEPTSGGIILFICVLLSLLLANSPLGAGFQNVLDTPIGFASEHIHLRYSVSLWINDGLMAIFFLLVGLEIKRELINGELSSPKKAALPILCAFGGAVVPAIIYFLINHDQPTHAGWGMPMATDIAFALAVIAMLGKRVPVSLKVFLAALAIVDDLIAIVVIALFYAQGLHWEFLGYAGAVFVLLLLFNRLGVRQIIWYLIPGLFMWYFIHHSGIHATISGVLTAMCIPLSVKGQKKSPLLHLEHALSTPVSFIIVPLFALSNTAIRFESGMLEGLFSPLGAGVILGLLLGKPIGILLMTRIATWIGVGEMPKGASWGQLLGVGLLAGIGFTMSIFIAILSFDDGLMIAEAKFAILAASLISGLVGSFLLSFLHKAGKK